MAALAREPMIEEPALAGVDLDRLLTMTLARIAAEADGVGMAELVRDLAPLFGPRLDRSRLRDLLAQIIATAEMEGLVARDKGRWLIAAAGLDRLARSVGDVQAVRGGWLTVRNGLLVAAALGLKSVNSRRLRGLMRIEGLSAAIVAAAFGVGPRSAANATRLRNALAAIAIERAFGNGLEREIAAPRDLSAKASRLLAAQLCSAPRDYGRDTRLIAELAGDVLGIKRGGLAALRLGVLRLYLSGHRLAAPTVEGPPQPVMAVPSGPAAAQTASTDRPDLATFARATLEIAQPLAEGWTGNRKAYIAHVLAGLAAAHPAWRLDTSDMKAMLVEAHRHGLIVLGTADLRDQRNRSDIDASATIDRNTVWHFVRIEAEPRR